MSDRIIVLSTLLPGVDPADYEEWIRAVDVPVTRKIACIQDHVVARLDGPLMEEDPVPYHYVEIVDVTSVDEYREEISANPEAAIVMQEFARFVGSSVIAYGQVLDLG